MANRSKTTSYIPLDSPIDRLNPMTKATAVLCFGLAAVFSPVFYLPYFFLIILFVVAYQAKVLKLFSKFIIGFAIPITVMLLIIHGLYSTKNVTIIADLGFAKLGLEGVLYTFKLVGGLLVFLGSFFLFTTTTHPGKMVTSMVEGGMNPRIGYLVLATIQIVPQMQRRTAVIQQAQMARGVEVEGNLMTRAAAFVPLIGPLVMGSLVDMQERGMTLETRGFGMHGVKTTSYIEVQDPPQEKMARKVMLWATGVLVVAFIIISIIF